MKNSIVETHFSQSKPLTLKVVEGQVPEM